MDEMIMQNSEMACHQDALQGCHRILKQMIRIYAHLHPLKERDTNAA
jgi:hypothetical protein